MKESSRCRTHGFSFVFCSEAGMESGVLENLGIPMTVNDRNSIDSDIVEEKSVFCSISDFECAFRIVGT